MIKIYHNEIELPVKNDTLTIVSKNSVFSDSFSLEYSKHPFLIIENSKTVEALGSRHISSLNKKKEYNVRVFQDNKVYFGKLKVMSYVQGARKCNLVFGSEILKVLDAQISEFMPTVYFATSIPYSDKSQTLFNQKELIDKLTIHEKKTYPDVDFQFPEISAKDFFGEKTSDKSDWRDYSGFLNYRKGDLMANEYNTQLKERSRNYTSIYPVVFILSIIKHIIKSVDYREIGGFINSILVKNLVYLSNNSNTYEYLYSNNELKLDITNDFAEYQPAQTLKSYVKTQSLSYFGIGKMKVDGLMDFTGMYQEGLNYSVNVTIEDANGTVIKTVLKETSKRIFNTNLLINVNFEFDIPSEYLNYNIKIQLWGHYNVTVPATTNYGSPTVVHYSVRPKGYFHFTTIETHLKSFMHHPTFDLKRHVPEWTVSQLLSNLKNLFNLKIDVDDALKTINFEFVDEYLNDVKIVDLSGYKLEEKDYENNQSDVFKIAYANDEFIRIDKEGISKKTVLEKDAVTIDNEFLTLPFNGTHHELKKDDLQKGAVLLLNKQATPNTTDRVNGQSLSLYGFAGIGEIHWKDWIKFRQNSSKLTLVGEIHKHDLIRINNYKKVYYQNIVFLVEEVATKENNGFTETTLKLQSKII